MVPFSGYVIAILSNPQTLRAVSVCINLPFSQLHHCFINFTSLLFSKNADPLAYVLSLAFPKRNHRSAMIDWSKD